MLKKVYFPRIILPLSIVCAQLVHFILAVIPLGIIMLWFGGNFSIAIILLPLVFIINAILALGFALVLSCIYVYFRDISQIMDTIMLAWFFMTPILYPLAFLKNNPNIWSVLRLNPLIPVMELYRSILYYSTFPSLKMFLIACFWSFVMLIIGWSLFIRLENNMVKSL